MAKRKAKEAVPVADASRGLEGSEQPSSKEDTVKGPTPLTEAELASMVGSQPRTRKPPLDAPPGTACGCVAQGFDHRCLPGGNVWVFPYTNRGGE